MISLISRDPNLKDPHFGAGYNLECQHCGRLYDAEDTPPLKEGGPCPDEDCPSHWELIGKDFPA